MYRLLSNIVKNLDKNFKLVSNISGKLINLPQRIRVGNSTLIEEEINQLARIHASIRIGIRDDSSYQCHYKHFGDGVLAQLGVLAVVAPVNVAFDKYCCNAALRKQIYCVILYL